MKRLTLLFIVIFLLLFIATTRISGEEKVQPKLVGEGWKLTIVKATLTKESGELSAPAGESLLILSLKAKYQKAKKKSAPRLEDAKITDAESGNVVMSKTIGVRKRSGGFILVGVTDGPIVTPIWKKKKFPKKFTFVCCVPEGKKNLNFELPGMEPINLGEIIK